MILETESEIINKNIELEFRSIDTKEPFNRKTMSNWSDKEDNSKDNDTVKKYIKDAEKQLQKELFLF